MNRAAFFDHLRGSLFLAGIKPSQVTTIEAILDAGAARGVPRAQLAYMLATARWEPGEDMMPKEENLWYSAKRLTEVWPLRFQTLASADPFAKNPRALANKVYNGRMGNRLSSEDGWAYRGRGLVQITGRDNYERAGTKLGLPLAAQPDLALELDTAVKILVVGMLEGWFTGKTSAEMAATVSFDDDRAIINGKDKAAVISAIAVQFDAALAAAGWGATAATPPAAVDAFAPEELAVLRALAGWRSRCPVSDEVLAAVTAWQAELKEVSNA